MDKVFIRGLTLLATIGVYEWEKPIKQRLVLDLTMGWDNRPAAASDNIHLALDYASVSEAVEALVCGEPHELVETVAEKVAALILENFKAPWVQVRVSKPGAVAAADCVGVEIERRAN
jgi:dihydroneopterin aldolase